MNLSGEGYERWMIGLGVDDRQKSIEFYENRFVLPCFEHPSEDITFPS